MLVLQYTKALVRASLFGAVPVLSSAVISGSYVSADAVAVAERRCLMHSHWAIPPIENQPG